MYCRLELFFSFFVSIILIMITYIVFSTSWNNTATVKMRRAHDSNDDRRMGDETGDEEMRRTMRKRPKRLGCLLGYCMFFLLLFFSLTHFFKIGSNLPIDNYGM